MLKGMVSWVLVERHARAFWYWREYVNHASDLTRCAYDGSCHEHAPSGVQTCLRVWRVEVQVQQVAIDYLSVVCVLECECKVTRKVYEFRGQRERVWGFPRQSRNGKPNRSLTNDDMRVWSGSKLDAMWARVAGSLQDPVRQAGPEPGVCTWDEVRQVWVWVDKIGYSNINPEDYST